MRNGREEMNAGEYKKSWKQECACRMRRGAGQSKGCVEKAERGWRCKRKKKKTRQITSTRRTQSSAREGIEETQAREGGEAERRDRKEGRHASAGQRTRAEMESETEAWRLE